VTNTFLESISTKSPEDQHESSKEEGRHKEERGKDRDKNLGNEEKESSVVATQDQRGLTAVGTSHNKSHFTHRKILIRDTVPQKNRPAMLTILNIVTDSLYPITQNIFQYLHNSNIACLRAACETIAQNITVRYKPVAIGCRLHQPWGMHRRENIPLCSDEAVDRYWPRVTCTVVHLDSLKDGPMRPYQGNSPGFWHPPRGEYWICHKCQSFSLNIDNISAQASHRVSHGVLGRRHKFEIERYPTELFLHSPVEVTAADESCAFVSVCDTCIKAHSSWVTMDKTEEIKDGWRRGRCRCFNYFMEGMKASWLCFDCAMTRWQNNYYTPIWRRADGLRLLTRSSHFLWALREWEGRKAVCKHCEQARIRLRYEIGPREEKVAVELDTMYYKCARCDELYIEGDEIGEVGENRNVYEEKVGTVESSKVSRDLTEMQEGVKKPRFLCFPRASRL
jgi:hypothetical protein